MFRAATLLLIRHSNIVLAAAGLWLLVGAAIALQTPIDALPDLSENQVLIHTDWPGQNPLEIERQITRPLSVAFQGLPGVRTVRGSSDVGFSLLHLIFDDSVSFEEARRRVTVRLSSLSIDLPSNVTPRMAADGIPTGQIFWYTVEGTATDLAELRRWQDHVIAPQLRSVAGVAEVASVGGFIAELHVEADLEKLSQAGLTLIDLEKALVTITGRQAGQVVSTANSEFLVQTVRPEGTANEPLKLQQILEESLLPLSDGRAIRLDQVAQISTGAAPRRGAFEKDGSEAVAGIVHLRYGFNPLAVTRAVRKRLMEIADGLPRNIRLVPCYDRTPLILNAVDTVTRTLVESLLVASVCVILVMRHWRTSLVIVGTLPLVVLGSFLGMSVLRSLGVADVQTNIMSLAGIVVSIGVLVDSSIVVADNVSHELRRRFGTAPVEGDISELVADACVTVGRPAFLAVMMMIVSFLPVFFLQGIDGRMYRPLAWTKTLVLLSAALLTITLVPVLCAKLIRGRIRDESESAIVASIISIYRPTLDWLLDHPLPLVLLLCVTLIGGAAATGVDLLVRIVVVTSIGITWVVDTIWHRRSTLRRAVLTMGLVIVGLALQSTMRPIGLALRLPLDEGMVMDMPITIPRVNISQAVDDLKARNMVLCRFPEVSMVTGKAGRADTPFDPAPVDMIETMIEFQPRSRWPRRRLMSKDAQAIALEVIERLVQSKLVEAPANPTTLASEIVDAGTVRFDAIQREVCWQRLQVFQSELARELATMLVKTIVARLEQQQALTQSLTQPEVVSLVTQLSASDLKRLGQQVDLTDIHVLLSDIRNKLQIQGALKPTPVEDDKLLSAVARSTNLARSLFGMDVVKFEDELHTTLKSQSEKLWQRHVSETNAVLRQRAIPTWVQIVCAELFARQAIVDDALSQTWKQILAARYSSLRAQSHHADKHMGMPGVSPLPVIDPHPAYDAIVAEVAAKASRNTWLWPHDSDSLNMPGGELDASVQMPGWANVWTKPIQNRVDMLASGVNSEVGVRVLGHDLESVVQCSDEIAQVLRDLPGAANVVADPIRGKGYLTVIPDHSRASQRHVALSDLESVVALSSSGRVVSKIDHGTVAQPVRLKIAGGEDDPVDRVRQLLIPCRTDLADAAPTGDGVHSFPTVPLEDVADVRITDGPATIKSENGWLRNYVRLNVRDRDPASLVASAQRLVQQTVKLPPGVFIEWTGQYEHAASTRRMMFWMVPIVFVLILVILYVAFRDLADAGLMLLSVPGALAGGVLCEWLMGFPFSVAVGIGYIACFGMAAATSMVMLVYLREAVASAGGLQQMSLQDLRSAVLSGAVHRLRPKLLTEATTILGLAPMLWSAGVGADVIRPMGAPVLGGILIADEVIDLLLPIAFYAVRRYRWRRLHQENTSLTGDLSP